MGPSTLTARFADPRQAQAAIDALLAAGFPAASVSITGPALAAGHEGRFLGRVVILIVLWSIPGGAIGAALGLLLAFAGIGPGGTTGTVVQVVSWLIIGHLLAGMWAGYVLLADRTLRELAPRREAAIMLSVMCGNEAETEAARRVLSTLEGQNSP